jgi:ABC-type multidrug transport system fused ATPase/permease subunit
MPLITDLRLILSLWKTIAAGHVKAFVLYAIALLLDGILTAGVATTIAPIADYFLDKSFVQASAITVKYIEVIAFFGLRPGLEIFLTIFVAANLIKAASSVALHYCSRMLAYRVVHDLSNKCLGAFLSSSLLFFLSYPIGTLQNTLGKASENLGDGIASSFILAAVLMQILALSYVAWLLSPAMVLVCLALVLFFLLVTRGLDRRNRQLASLTTSTSNVLAQSLIEPLMGAKLILAYGRGSLMVGKYSDAYTRHAHVAVRSQVLSNAVPSFYQAFGLFSVSLALYISISNGENLPTLIAALWTLLRIVPLFSQFLGNVTFISNAVPSFNQYNDMLGAARKLSLKHGVLRFTSFQTGISLENIAFKYPGRDQALAGVNLFIPKGSFTAFVGESGSGKTTTADMILRLLAPDSGTIRIDLTPLQDYEMSSFLDRIGYVPQEAFLFNASIRDNLTWALPRAADGEIWEALRLANIDEFVRTLPEQLNTFAGDRGVALSGGQRQRIALARALLKKPDILILDEATSALDSESERLIMQSIDLIAPYTTIIVIAHRLSTIARADLVCVFRDGHVVESGSYLELSKRPQSMLCGMITAQNQR